MAKGQTFGEFLRSERERKGWKIRGLADRIGISSDKTITSWEEDRSRPQADNLAELGREFGWDYNVVMTYLGAPALTGLDRVATGIASRPLLRELFHAARGLDDGPLSYLVTSARGLAAQSEVVDGKETVKDDGR